MPQLVYPVNVRHSPYEQNDERAVPGATVVVVVVGVVPGAVVVVVVVEVLPVVPVVVVVVVAVVEPQVMLGKVVPNSQASVPGVPSIAMQKDLAVAKALLQLEPVAVLVTNDPSILQQTLALNVAGAAVVVVVVVVVVTAGTV